VAGPVNGAASYAEILVKLFEVGVQLRIGEPVDNTAVLHNAITVGHSRGEAEILLDQKDGKAALFELLDGLADLLDDDRGTRVLSTSSLAIRRCSYSVCRRRARTAVRKLLSWLRLHTSFSQILECTRVVH
jgi:hypothetical protein